MAPRAAVEPPPAREVGEDGPSPGQADLPGVRVAAEVEVDPERRGHVVDLRGVDEGDGERVGGRLEGVDGLVGEVVVDVVRPDDLESGVAASEVHPFVDEHPHAHLLERRDHVAVVVVPEHPEDAFAAPQPGHEGAHALHDRADRPVQLRAVVAGEGAEVELPSAQSAEHRLLEAVHAVEVEVRQVEDRESVELRGQAGQAQLELAQLEVPRVAHALLVPADEAQPEPQRAHQEEEGVPVLPALPAVAAGLPVLRLHPEAVHRPDEPGRRRRPSRRKGEAGGNGPGRAHARSIRPQGGIGPPEVSDEGCVRRRLEAKRGGGPTKSDSVGIFSAGYGFRRKGDSRASGRPPRRAHCGSTENVPGGSGSRPYPDRIAAGRGRTAH